MYIEINDVLIEDSIAHNLSFEQETTVAIHDGKFWQSIGIAYLRAENGQILATIRLYVNIDYSKKYPMPSIDNHMLTAIFLVDNAANSQVKHLGHPAYASKTTNSFEQNQFPGNADNRNVLLSKKI
jgi:hypothetical protein